MTPEERAKTFVKPWQDMRAPRDFLHDSARPSLEPGKRQAAWGSECRNARKVLPAWSYHRDWLNGYALEFLPAVCAAVGTGPALVTLERPLWWSAEEPGRVLALLATPNVRHILFLDRASGYWEEPTLALRGRDLIDLVATRHALTPAKAAWRLSKLVRLRSPMP